MMAPLLSPAAVSAVPRISQVLPTVKCSNCNNPVPLAELGDHVCPPTPPLPAIASSMSPKPTPALPKPSFSPSAAVALLPARLQNLVAPARAESPGLSSPSADQDIRPRAPSNASSPRPSIDSRSRTPSNNSSGRPNLDMRARTPSNNMISRPSVDVSARTLSNNSAPRSNYIGSPAGNSPARPGPEYRVRTPSNSSRSPSVSRGPGIPPQGVPPSLNGSLSPLASADPYRMRSPISPQNAPPIAQPAEEVINTASGGEAGMAGVGRRGFAAAARAMHTPIQSPGVWHDSRGNSPQFLDTRSASYGNPHARSGSQLTPSTPHSQYDRSPSPHSPYSRTPSPGYRMPEPSRGAVSAPSLRTSSVSRPISPTSSSSLPNSESPVTPMASTRLPLFDKMKPEGGDILYDSNNRSKLNTNLDYPKQDNMTRARSESTSVGLPPSIGSSRAQPAASPGGAHQRSNTGASSVSGSEYGLAYADSTADEDESPISGLPARNKSGSILRNINGSRSSKDNDNVRSHIKFPSKSSLSASPPRKTPSRSSDRNERSSANSASMYSDDDGDDVRARAAASTKASQRSASSRSTSSRSSSNKSSSSGHRSNNSSGSGSLYPRSRATDRGMETLEEDLDGEMAHRENERPDASSSDPHRSRTLPGSSRHSPDSRQKGPPSPVVRSRTSPSSQKSDSVGKAGSSRRVKDCVRCDKRVEDGRWVAVDGGGALCERCWKNMYLPKCRRCDLPIEKAAVSSSDGQLKGKYHKECFNCHTCHKPFPDKTFYVFDGRPYCAYHYHEANDSLCAAARCGQPIEGPCAVSHSGDRYHPEHFLCEFDGYPACKERLAEYWEVDGRMLCERHAQASRATMSDDGSDYGDDDDRDYVPTGRAMKRITRFIDLGDNGLR
ncbi:hypothetical protein HGRIS_012910 [Hohenbuehelia grisea]|uniref:LIM zinc-binding domain-containing protein n=1 Tax=Hohenbuehelia grisea TaxID=104357 RepID=A0ABR3ITU3_9AGAR